MKVLTDTPDRVWITNPLLCKHTDREQCVRCLDASPGYGRIKA